MKYLKISVLFFLILGLSACSFGGQKEDTSDWEDEVLLASECGMDGLQCCLPPEEECKYGQECCYDPKNPSLNYCADDCTLGREGSFCRIDDPKCDSGFACSDNRCMVCGQVEGPCCYEVNGESECGGDLICNNGVCEQCGLPGNICCDDGEACLNEDMREKGRTECQRNNICSYCGYGGTIVCSEEPFCNANHLLNGQNCFQCGNLNQPCCKVNVLTISECSEEQDLRCELGFCTK